MPIVTKMCMRRDTRPRTALFSSLTWQKSCFARREWGVRRPPTHAVSRWPARRPSLQRDGVAVPARIGGARECAGRRIDGDGLHASDLHRPGIEHLEFVPTRSQRVDRRAGRSEEHTSELQSRGHLVCRPLLEKKKPIATHAHRTRKKKKKKKPPRRKTNH